MVFAIFALPLGLLLTFSVPLGQVADEPAHILKADSLLHGEWIGRRAPGLEPDGTVQTQEGVDADRALLAALVLLPHPLDRTPRRVDPNALAVSERIPFGHAEFGEIGTIASYFPAFYLPAAGALAVSRALGLGVHDAFLAARVTNFLLAVALGLTALVIARRCHAVLFATLLLPPTLGLMASVNQDGLLIGCAVLAASFATRVSAGRPPWRQPSLIAAAVLICLICLAKPPYLPMAVLLLLPYGRRWRDLSPSWFAARMAIVVLLLLPVLAWTVANVHYSAAPVYRGPMEAGPLWPGPRPAIFTGTDMSAQLRVLLTKPWRLLLLPVHSMLTHPAIFRQVIDQLGWLNLILPSWLVLMWAFALVAATFGNAVVPADHPEAEPEWPAAAMLAAAVLLTVLLIYLSQYLSFTPVGWTWISGPQGRYLIPLLPMIGLAVPDGLLRRPAPVWLPLLPATFAAWMSLWALPLRVQDFYLLGLR